MTLIVTSNHIETNALPIQTSSGNFLFLYDILHTFVYYIYVSDIAKFYLYDGWSMRNLVRCRSQQKSLRFSWFQKDFVFTWYRVVAPIIEHLKFPNTLNERVDYIFVTSQFLQSETKLNIAVYVHCIHCVSHEKPNVSSPEWMTFFA